MYIYLHMYIHPTHCLRKSDGDGTTSISLSSSSAYLCSNLSQNKVASFS